MKAKPVEPEEAGSVMMPQVDGAPQKSRVDGHIAGLDEEPFAAAELLKRGLQVSLSFALSAALAVGVAGRSRADGGPTTYQCDSSSVLKSKWAFSLDFVNHVVSIEVPVNWVWFTSQFVMFGHSVVTTGGRYTTQSYTLDQATGAFEACDYASTTEYPAACDRAICTPQE